MIGNFARSLVDLLQSEGGFSDNPADPGGVTNLGVTLTRWSEWTGQPITVEQMRALTPAQIAPLYDKEFWDAVGADGLDPGVDYFCFDGAVNQGPGRMARWLQQAVAVNQDGVVGPQTIAAAHALGPALLLPRLDSLRWMAYRQEPTTQFAEFGGGWLNRLNRVLAQAQTMAKETTS